MVVLAIGDMTVISQSALKVDAITSRVGYPGIIFDDEFMNTTYFVVCTCTVNMMFSTLLETAFSYV